MRDRLRHWFAAGLTCFGSLLAHAAQPYAAQSVSEAIAQRPIDVSRLADADRLIESAVKRGEIPGGVLLVGRGGTTVHLKAYGHRSLQPTTQPMTVDTIFDLASLSKPIGCATSLMILADHGRIDLQKPVAAYVPAFAANGKDRITVADLMTHQGGLIADNPIADFADGPAKALQRTLGVAPLWPAGAHFTYSDVGYIALGEVVQAVYGRMPNQDAHDEIFAPLGMAQTAYLPPSEWRSRIAPTERRGDHWMVGEVHDPRAFALGGFAGHAGLFATAGDVGRFCQMILNGGELDGRRILSTRAVQEMTRPRRLPGDAGVRSLGFDIDTAYSSCRGERFERGSTFGHTGFTGTMFWIDPKHDGYEVLLTNAVHPDGKGKVLKLRSEVSTAVAEALLGPAKPTEPVKCGIDVLEADHFAALQGKRVAVVANQTSVDANGRRLVDVLRNAKDVHVVKLFSPEHGLYGALDEKVGDAVDPATGLKVYSLYGDVRKPTKAMLEGVDAIVFDLQDVGARYYTYVSTMGLCMEAAAEHRAKMVVLDRPNPSTGLIVDGPLADAADLGFTAYAPLPISHGMTVGELAKYLNEERNIHCDLTVVPMRGWRRDLWWDETGRMWVNPSPNLRNPTQSLLYLALGFLEMSNISVGRGTDEPFERLGAPWIDGVKLAAALNAANLPGLRFTPIEFTPTSSKFANEKCGGVHLTLTNRDLFRPVPAGLTTAWHLRKLFGEKFEIDGVGKLLKNKKTLEALKTIDDPAKLPATWRESLEQFLRTRTKYLSYQ